MKPTKCPARKNKMRQEKRKMRGGEKAKSKSQDCCVTFKPKNYLEILLSARARTSQADILHLDQKAVKWQGPENHSTSFKTNLSAKSPGLIIWEINFSNGSVYSRSNTLRRTRKQKLTLLKDWNASDCTDVLCATVVVTGVDPLRKSYMYILPTIGNKKIWITILLISISHRLRHNHTRKQTIDPNFVYYGGKYESK